MFAVETNRAVVAHRALASRVLASSHLNKSARLTELFQYLCRRVLDEKVQEIYELELGHAIFGRPARYDTAVDNIVRVHASLLRKRLAEYFQTEGRDEEYIIEIPRGNYAPVFRRKGALEPTEAGQAPGNTSSTVTETMLPPRDRQDIWYRKVIPQLRRAGMRWIMPVLTIFFAVLALVLYVRVQHAGKNSMAVESAAHSAVGEFWSGIFREKQGVDVVMDDATLSFYQEVTGRSVAIEDYFDRSYLRSLHMPHNVAAHDPDWLHQLIIRRLSNYSGSSVEWKLAQLASAHHSNAKLQFARDLSFYEIKSDNMVLLGTPSSNPWIQLFESSLSVHWNYDNVDKSVYPVDTMAPADPGQFHRMEDIKTRDGYARIAFLPNLGGTGNVLILSGTGGAASDAVMDWMLDEAAMKSLRLQLPGSSSGFPYFEALLRIDKGINRPRNVTVVICRAVKPSLAKAPQIGR